MSTLLHRTFASAVFAVTALFVSSALAEERIALVIGNAAYTGIAELKNTHSDAELMAQSFRDVGFNDVKVVFDANRRQILDALNDFYDRSFQADWAVLYYAGHGIELNGENFLMPVDARLERTVDILDQGVSLKRVFQSVQAKSLRLIIVDACRNNPFASGLPTERTRSVATRGLAMIEAPTPGTAVAYAASDGQVAKDGPDGGNSPFASALAERLQEPGLDIRILFGKVHDDVMAATRQEQKPAFYTALSGDTFFFRAPDAAKPEQVAAVTPAPGVRGPDSAGAVLGQESQFYFVIQNSTDPRDFFEFLRHFPDGLFAASARRKMTDLEPGFWSSVQEADQIASYQEYVALYPEGPHAAEASQIVEARRRATDEAAAWAAIETSTRSADFDDFLRRFPNSRFASEAKGKLDAALAAEEERTFWAKASASGDRDLVQAYISRYPNGEFRKEASDLLVAITRGEQEKAFWARVERSQDPNEFTAYLRAFPDGAHAVEAEQRRQGLEDEIARRQQADRDRQQAELDRQQAEQDRLRAEQDRLRAEEARARAEDDTAWAFVRSSQDADAIRRYLELFPEGRHVAEAHQQIAALEPPELTGRELYVALQKALQVAGCYRAGVDGLWGRGSRSALADFLEAARMDAAPEPTAEILDAILARSEVECAAPPVVVERDPPRRVVDRPARQQPARQQPVRRQPAQVWTPPPVQRGGGGGGGGGALVLP